jgi:hypothetical protein
MVWKHLRLPVAMKTSEHIAEDTGKIGQTTLANVEGGPWLNTKPAVLHLLGEGQMKMLQRTLAKTNRRIKATQHGAKHTIAMCHLIGQFYVVILCLSFCMVAHLLLYRLARRS